MNQFVIPSKIKMGKPIGVKSTRLFSPKADFMGPFCNWAGLRLFLFDFTSTGDIHRQATQKTLVMVVYSVRVV